MRKPTAVGSYIDMLTEEGNRLKTDPNYFGRSRWFKIRFHIARAIMRFIIEKL